MNTANEAPITLNTTPHGRAHSLFVALAAFALGAFVLGLPVSARASGVAISAAEAHSRGYITLNARSAGGHSKTKVSIVNRTARSLYLDFSTVGFIPKSGKAQRIGLTYIEGRGKGSYRVHVKPRDSGHLVFRSRCLDSARPSPSTGSQLVPLRTALPSPVVSALRAGASQGEVWRITDRTQDWKSADPRNKSVRSGGGGRSTVTFNIRSRHPSTAYVQFRSSRDRTRFWPGYNRNYVQRGMSRQSYRLSCTPGEQICYGAYTASGAYWGAGQKVSKGCRSCCARCGGGSASFTLGR